MGVIVRFFMFLGVVALILFGLSPYYAIYRLDDALLANAPQTIAEWVDLEAVRNVHKKQLERQVQQNLGGTTAPLPNLLREGMQLFGNAAVDAAVDIDWVRESLRPKQATGDAYPSLAKSLSFAFFESPSRFLVRLGELGDNPIHFYLQWQPWNFPQAGGWEEWFWKDGLHRWKLSAIYS